MTTKTQEQKEATVKEVANKTPLTMEELLASAEFQPKSIKRGEVIEGVVVAVTPNEVLVDIGGKSEGLISGRELGEEDSDLKPGDKVLAYVMQSEDESGQTVLSVKRAGGEKRWRELQSDFSSESEVEVKGLETNRGGLVVDIAGVRGFIPSSQLDSTHAGNRGIGKVFLAKIIELDRKANRLILSQRVLTQEVGRKKFVDASERFHLGDILEGRISGVMPYGLFVTIEDGLEGLVHISEVSWDRVGNLSEQYKIGDTVKVKVLSIDPAAGRINLSIKSLTEDPWKDKLAKMKPGSKITGVVSKATQYGVFVTIEQGIEGLIHSSKIPAYMVEIKSGDKLNLVIESVNPESRRISLLVDDTSNKDEVKPIEELVSDSFTDSDTKKETSKSRKA